MTIHKLTAGDGYTYLTRQVAGADVAREKGQSAADYYTARGNPPGRWIGRGAPLLGLAGQQVTEDQMKALFGHGQHPDAQARIASYLAAHTKPGMTPARLARLSREAIKSATLGRPFPRYAPLERFDVRVRRRLETITGQTGRDPTAAEVKKVHREEARRQRAAVAGYDAVFAPVKSAALLWALDERPHVRQAVRAAHQEAMDAAMGLLEQHAAYTRTGTGGLAQIEIRGLIAAAFDHYDSRAGDPNLHTHVAISSKVQGIDGRWRSLDARGLYRMTVAASECYNTAFETALGSRLGVTFAPRPDTSGHAEPVREISDVPYGYIKHFSHRRTRIEDRYSELIRGYRREHGHDPPRAICHQLARQANLDTRQGKKPARSLTELRALWRQELTAVFGRGAVRRLMAAVPATLPAASAPQADIPLLSVRTVANVARQRSTWTVWNLRAEAERLARTTCTFTSPADHERVVTAIVEGALSPRLCLKVDAPALLDEPAVLRRSDGASVFAEHAAGRYTSQQVLDAEARLVAAARTPMSGGLGGAFTAAALDGFEAAARTRLDPGQRSLVSTFASGGRLLAVGLGPAGSGKTTAMRALAAVLAQGRRRLVPLATSAAAADVLGRELGVHADNLAKFLHEYTDGPHAAKLRSGAPVPARLRMFALRPGDVVLVDEAGMAATHDLDQLVTIATMRGAAVRLLGDHRQLSAVESGGALRLLACEAGAAELTTLYRFADPAEAQATLQLRTGDAAGLDYYFTRSRVRSGSLQAMTEAAYTGWKTDMLAGKTTLMAATASTDVTALCAQARADRVAAGQVEPDGVTLADGTLAGRGDWILTRHNNRRLTTMGGRDWVKNGDAWAITSHQRDGSLRVRHLGHGGQVTLPASYAQTHVQLLYATTAHRAQGTTVDTAHPLITPGMTRESLYVITTRARERTTLYTATHELLPLDEDERLDQARTDPRSYAARELLENVLAREGADLSATEAIRTAQEQAGSLATLVPRYTHAAQLAAASRYEKAAIRALGTDAGHTLITDDAWGVVVSALHTAEAQGWQPERLLATVVPARELRTADSTGAVIAWRIEALTTDRTAPPRLDQPSDADLRRYHALMDTIPVLRRAGPDADQTGPVVPYPQDHGGRHEHPHVSRQALARLARTAATAWDIDEAQLVCHRAWPHLAAALIRAGQAEQDLSRLLAQVRGPTRRTPGDDISQLARTTRRLLRARGIERTAGPLPAHLWYAEAATAVLGPNASENARSQPAWLAVEAALRRAEHAGHHPATVLTAALQPAQPSTANRLAELLAERIGRWLADHPTPASQPESGDPALQIARARLTLAWTLKAAENNGTTAEDVLGEAAGAPDLDTVPRIAHEAAVRQQQLAIVTSSLPPWIAGHPPMPQEADGELEAYLHDAAELITARVRDLALDAAQRRPAWTSGLGDPPADPSASSDWMRHLGIISAYRDQYQTSTDDPQQILGPYTEPGHAGHAAYWHAAESVLAARRLAGLEPVGAADATARTRAQLAADIYLALSDGERAAIQTAMIGRLGRAWFGSRNEIDDHAVTRPAYGPYLIAILSDSGRLALKPTLSDMSNRVPSAARPGQTPHPLEAALAQHRTAGQADKRPRTRRTSKARNPSRPRLTAAAEQTLPEVPDQQRPDPDYRQRPVQQP
ncbi:MAG TPA: MobF family relaxase [Streptosporangiaceae bacterium]